MWHSCNCGNCAYYSRRFNKTQIQAAWRARGLWPPNAIQMLEGSSDRILGGEELMFAQEKFLTEAKKSGALPWLPETDKAIAALKERDLIQKRKKKATPHPG